MRRLRSRQSRCSTGPPPFPAGDPGVPAPGHPSSSPPLPVRSLGAQAPNQADPQASPTVFSWYPGALASPLLGRALGSRTPRSAGPCTSAEDWDVLKRGCGPRTRGPEKAGPVRGPGRNAPYWLRPGGGPRLPGASGRGTGPKPLEAFSSPQHGPRLRPPEGALPSPRAEA